MFTAVKTLNQREDIHNMYHDIGRDEAILQDAYANLNE
jgi:hypothetical protein